VRELHGSANSPERTLGGLHERLEDSDGGSPRRHFPNGLRGLESTIVGVRKLAQRTGSASRS